MNDRRQMVKLVYLGFVSRLMPRIDHDGFFGLLLVAKEQEDADGNVVSEITTMTKEVFVDILKKKSYLWFYGSVVEAHNIKVIIQMDRAGGHGGSRADIEKGTITELNEWTCHKHLNVEFRAQQARSPDMNMCDLDFWHNFQSFIRI